MDPSATLRTYKPLDAGIVTNFMCDYYKEDQGIDLPLEHIVRTLSIVESPKSPLLLSLILLEDTPIGYVLIVPYWSNEYGGTIAFIDELYIAVEHREKGYGSSILKQIIDLRPCDAVAIQLEVTPHNDRARTLYEKLGFKPYENQLYIIEYRH